MQKIKILAVAPYEGMAETIASIATERDDVEMTVQTGDLNTGKKIALELSHKNYDVILSRGGTAELIRSTVEIPVVDIPISGYDILRTIKLAQNYSGKFVIAGFSGITKDARVLCDLLQYDIDILTFTTEADSTATLKAAKKKGCTLVLCDMTGSKAAQKLHLNSVLITSGTESINAAIDEAV
ncbi:MAG: PrpR N-terminal domain-containing protein [Blautia sp.]